MSRTLVIAFCLCALFAACGKGADETVIRIGVAGPMTGDQAKNGEELWYGTVLAAEEWNRKGGVLGKKIELVQRDDQALPTFANQVASELIDAGVKAVIGHYNSGVTIPACLEYAKRKILMITPAATNPFITENAFREGYRTIFRLCGRDDVQGGTGAEFVAKTLGLTRVAILHDKTQYGQGLADFFRQGLIANGVTVTVFEGFDDKETNYRPFFPKLKEGDPQLFYFGGIYSQGGPLARQAKENGIPIPFMSGDGVFHQEFIDKAGDKSEGAFFTFPDVYSSEAARSFSVRYDTRFTRKVGPYSVYAYTAANCVIESMERAGSAEGEAVAKAMREMVHETVFGPVEFDEKGDVKGSLYRIWTVRGGKFVLHGSGK
jgi:branched-chain amino acid transport system substrate-binding protein